MTSIHKLSLINPDLLNRHDFDYSLEYINNTNEPNGYLSSVKESKLLPCNTPIKFNGINLGDGKMEYILDKNDKLMMTNAWQAITLTNTWDFISQEIETFMLSTDPRILQISEKMEELGYREHSGCSFNFTMRNMLFLVRKGEEEFKKLFDVKNEENGQKVIINF
jgi:hypothetical protein